MVFGNLFRRWNNSQIFTTHSFSNRWLRQNLSKRYKLMPVLEMVMHGFESRFSTLWTLNLYNSILGVYGAGCLLTEGCRGEGGYLINSEGNDL